MHILNTDSIKKIELKDSRKAFRHCMEMIQPLTRMAQQDTYHDIVYLSIHILYYISLIYFLFLIFLLSVSSKGGFSTT